MVLLQNVVTTQSYKMADILQDVRALNENDDADETEIKGLVKMLNPKYNPDWEEARFLGRGTVTTSQIFYTSPTVVQLLTPVQYLLTVV